MYLRIVPWLVRVLWLAVSVGLAIYFSLTLWLAFVGLSYPYQLDYGEGIVLWFAREIAHGHSIYKSLTGYPYASSNYPPVSFLLSASLMPILGDGYTAGRFLNLAAALVVTALIYRIVRTETRDWRAAILAALFFIGSTYVYHWAPLFRADLIGLGFTFAGVFFVWQYGRTTDDRQRKIYFSLFALCFLLALFTKQTLIAAPAAAFFAILRRDKRAAILFAFTLGVIGGAIYCAIDFATRGGFTFGLIDSNATVFLPNQLFDLINSFVVVYAILIALAIWAWMRRVRAGQFGVLEAYAVTAAATLIFAGRLGAWENYFFEAVVAICVFSGFAVAREKSKVNSLPSSVLRPPSFVLPLLLLLQLALYARDHDPRAAANLVAQDYPANQQLAGLLTRTNGTVISEDMGALVTSGKQVSYYTFQYSSLAQSGIWDQGWELNSLREGMFPLVILERGTREDVDHYHRFTHEFVSALDRYYALSQVIGKYEIYAPAPPLQLQLENFGDAITMLGWSSQPSNLQSSSPNLQISIVWQARVAPTLRYTAFVHLEKADGEKVTQDDHEPRGGNFPTTHWSSNEMEREVYSLGVPASLPPGKYRLRVGWYDTETGVRLPVQGSADDTVVLTTFELR